MRFWRILRRLPAALAVSACAQNPNNLRPTTSTFRHLKSDAGGFHRMPRFACAEKKPVSLSADQWRRVTSVFKRARRMLGMSGSRSRAPWR